MLCCINQGLLIVRPQLCVVHVIQKSVHAGFHAEAAASLRDGVLRDRQLQPERGTTPCCTCRADSQGNVTCFRVNVHLPCKSSSCTGWDTKAPAVVVARDDSACHKT